MQSYGKPGTSQIARTGVVEVRLDPPAARHGHVHGCAAALVLSEARADPFEDRFHARFRVVQIEDAAACRDVPAVQQEGPCWVCRRAVHRRQALVSPAPPTRKISDVHKLF